MDSGLKATSKCPESSVVAGDATVLEDFCHIHTVEDDESNSITENNNSDNSDSTDSNNNNTPSKPSIDIDDSNLSDTGL